MSDSTEPSRTRRSLARPKCWSALAAILALTLTEIPVAAQVSNSAGPTPPVGSPPPPAPLAGCVYMPNGVALTGYIGPMGLTCGANGGLNVNILSGGPGGGGGGSVTQGTTPWADNITQFGGANVVTGTGPSGAGIPRVTVSADSFPSIQPVSGTVSAQQPNGTTYAVTWTGQTVGVTGTVTANQGTPGASAWKVDGSGVTQPVSGTVTANQGGAPWSTTDTNAATAITAPGTTATKDQGVQGGGPTAVPVNVYQQPALSGKVTQTSTAVSANTSTQIVAANTSRIGLEIQCDGTAAIGLDRNGGTLTSATAAPLVIPASSYPLYTPPVVPQTAVTAYTGTAQTCRVTEYNR